MNREILFRGKSIKNGKWEHGYLYVHEPPLQCLVPENYVAEKSKYYILKTAFADWNMIRQVEFTEVDPETVGQFTGLYDNSETRIFEGDVVEYEEERGVVSFSEGSFWIDFDGWTNVMSEFNSQELEIIGNIHEKQ